MSDKPSEALSKAARRASQQPFFLASVFQSYQAANAVDDAALAGLLGCAVHDLPRLALCRRPVGEAAAFAADIDHLARRFQLDSEQLASVVRQVDALKALRTYRTVSKQAPGMLRAARDRDEADAPGKEEDGD